MPKRKPIERAPHVHGADCEHGHDHDHDHDHDDHDHDHDHHHPSGPEPYRRTEPKLGRNDACPCGSGKKYKKCHGEGA